MSTWVKITTPKIAHHIRTCRKLHFTRCMLRGNINAMGGDRNSTVIKSFAWKLRARCNYDTGNVTMVVNTDYKAHTKNTFSSHHYSNRNLVIMLVQNQLQHSVVAFLSTYLPCVHTNTRIIFPVKRVSHSQRETHCQDTVMRLQIADIDKSLAITNTHYPKLYSFISRVTIDNYCPKNWLFKINFPW